MQEQLTIPGPFKPCRYCGQSYPATTDYFHRHNTTRDGLHTMCKPCKRDYDRGRAASNVESRKIAAAEYYRANAENIKARTGAHARANRELLRPYFAAYAHRRRAVARGLEATLSAEEWTGCKAHFGGCCYCDKRTRALEQDHFVALKRGGGYTASNIVPACRSCNASKSNHAFEDWYPKQPFYSAEREAAIMTFLEFVHKITGA